MLASNGKHPSFGVDHKTHLLSLGCSKALRLGRDSVKLHSRTSKLPPKVNKVSMECLRSTASSESIGLGT